MPRKRTGSAWCVDGVWYVQATLKDGSRSKQVAMPPGTTEAKARDFAQRIAEHGVRLPNVTKATDGETLAQWSKRWWQSRTAKGLDTASDTGRWTKWVLARLGQMPITEISTGDIEDLVHHLDQTVLAGKLSWKSAINVWGLVTKAFDDAHRAKDRALRVLGSNPAIGVRGPDRGAEKAKAGLYPDQFLSLIGSEEAVIQHRVAVALAVYLYLRPSEINRLDWTDVDMEHELVTIHRGRRGSTKTGDTRKVPIESTLRPLLEALRGDATEGQVFALPDDGHLSRWLQRELELVGADKALTETSDTRRRLRFYDLRAVGITWRLVRKDAPFDVMLAAGHDRFETTQRYVREADVLRAGYGDVFPELPASLIDGAKRWRESLNAKLSIGNDGGGGGNRTRVREASTASSFTCVVAVSPATESTDSAVTYSPLSRPRYRGHPHAIQPS